MGSLEQAVVKRQYARKSIWIINDKGLKEITLKYIGCHRIQWETISEKHSRWAQ